MIIGIQGTLGQGKTTALVAFSLDYKTKTGLPNGNPTIFPALREAKAGKI
jgi:deoxyadenosine/deoxycytidine kinase